MVVRLFYNTYIRMYAIHYSTIDCIIRLVRQRKIIDCCLVCINKSQNIYLPIVSFLYFNK